MTKLQHPALSLLFCARWDDAFGWLHHVSEETIGAERAQRLLDKCGDRQAIQDEIRDVVDALYALGTHQAGELALAWSMMCCRATYPPSFRGLLPQLQYALDAADLDADDDGDCRDRLRIWWAAGAGDYVKEKRSMFAVAVAVLAGAIIKEPAFGSPAHEVDVAAWFRSAYEGPTLTVMPAEKATKLNSANKQFADILDKPLPLVVARDLAEARRRLGYEFPHAAAALDALFRDLREGEPIKLRNTILLGSPGCGKSRLVRKWAQAVSGGQQHVHRVDAAASGNDSHFAGVSKSWSSTEANVPARAVLASRTANPLVMIDELCKGSPRGGLNGTLWEALAGLADRETAARFRDPSLDCELRLDWVSFCCTANEVSHLPNYLKDRFRILKVPAPRLVDLPLLAASIVDDMLIEDGDEWAGSVAPFAPDELRVMGKAWEARNFSMRALQKIVAATLEARDAHAMRH
ncbi:AAA family ATPase [Bradyrhizobium sp. WYCCWR 12699]|uniref:AAA family ATPase n=1 Tax=Bradyrhizobium sp. WYCCWR 12699 TaxID=3064203 RepID=UPI0028A414E1|nr:AAA family ATPase [Bradyrhizobium sp. WYCCWR 12699]MDT4740251.1 AAA family ATPase [Bradyrhizobium sp. WYCCWR 12699]